MRRPTALFSSDLHGSPARYQALFEAIEREEPVMVLLAGDVLESGLASLAGAPSVLEAVIAPELRRLRARMGARFPPVCLIPGNDDGLFEEESFLAAEEEGLLLYLPCRRADVAGWPVYGYPYIPPSPFRLKHWERYDVSRYVDPGCTPPEEDFPGLASGFCSDVRHPTIAADLEKLTGDDDLSRAIFLFHAPPYETRLDRADLDGKKIDHCPLDVHIGSIAIRRFIEERQPLLSLHGHVHESARLTGSWRQQLGRTWAVTGAHDGPELALVRIPLDDPGSAERELI
ncbi:MAG: metallophosphoesterase family protein [Myxococcota bacterium]